MTLSTRIMLSHHSFSPPVLQYSKYLLIFAMASMRKIAEWEASNASAHRLPGCKLKKTSQTRHVLERDRGFVVT